RPHRVFRLQRLPDVDDELPDVQPGRVRLRGDAIAARPGADLRAGDGTGWRVDAGDQGGAPADRHGAARVVGAVSSADTPCNYACAKCNGRSGPGPISCTFPHTAPAETFRQRQLHV